MTARFSKRLANELKALQKRPPEGLQLEDCSNLGLWLIKVIGAPNTLYEGETFMLQFKFPTAYPMEAPEVIFVGNVPIHPHIYSNGHICLSILYDHWSPALTCSSVCLSILSMLSSNQQKVRPEDNEQYVRSTPPGKSPKSTKWWFHDDGV